MEKIQTSRNLNNSSKVYGKLLSVHEQKCSKIVFSRVWIITFKVRSLAQSDQTRRVITTFTPVWPGFEPSFFSFFEKISIPPKNCCTPFFRSFLSVIFCSFPPPPLSFFSTRAWIYKLLKIGRVYTIVWATAGITYAARSYLPIYRPAIKYWFSFTSMTMIRRHRGLVFYKSWADIGPPPVQIEKGPVFHGRARGNDDSRGWLEAPGWIRNEAHDSCLPIEEGSRGSSTGVFCKEISTDGEGIFSAAL